MRVVRVCVVVVVLNTVVVPTLRGLRVLVRFIVARLARVV